MLLLTVGLFGGAWVFRARGSAVNVLNEHAEAEEEVNRKSHRERLIKHLHLREAKRNCGASGALCRSVFRGSRFQFQKSSL